MDEVTILRLAQYFVACVCIVSGAAVARGAVKSNSDRQWFSMLIAVVISRAFLYVALELARRRIYV